MAPTYLITYNEEPYQSKVITNPNASGSTSASIINLAGLDTLWVSVDGAKAESYADVRIGAALPEIFENITKYRHQYFMRKGVDPDIGLAFVAMKRNIADLPILLRMSTKLGISRYLVTNVLPYTREMCDEMLYTRSMDSMISSPFCWAPARGFPHN